MKVKVNKKKVGIIVFLIVVIFICGNALAALLGAPNVFFAIRDLVNKEVEVEGKDNLLIADDEKEEENKNEEDIIDSDKDEEAENDLENIVLYNGMLMSVKPGVQTVSDMEITDEAEEKYNTKYYNYENGKDKGETEGKFGEETYEGYSVVTNVKKIAMTEEYNAIPREYKEIEELPEELSDMADYTKVEIHEIDLDGDDKNEYIVSYKLDYKENEIGDGEPEADSGIILFDEDYKKVADLVTLEDGFWGNIKEEDKKVFVSLENIEYIDLDNDDEMEIVIEVPTYDGVKLSILKYSDNKLEGEKNLKAFVNEGNSEEISSTEEKKEESNAKNKSNKLVPQLDGDFKLVEDAAVVHKTLQNEKKMLF